MVAASDIAIVSVAYQSGSVLPAMLDSLPREQQVVIVDNGPDDGMRALAAARGARVIVADQNPGFGGGCNRGAAVVTASHILFLNPDARLVPGTLNELAAAANRHPDAGGFGACQQDETGRRFYKRRTRIVRGLPELPRAVPTIDTVAPVLSGAALMVSRAAFDRVGGFDEAMFLFYEDDDLSLRLSHEVGPLYFIPAAEVLHFGGTSSPQTLETARFKGYHWGRSRVYASCKHGSRAPLLRGLLNGANFLLSARSLRSPAHRAEALGRLAGAWSQRRVAAPRQGASPNNAA